MSDYYELLGVDESASPAQIRAAYHSLAKVMHPDSGGSTSAFRTLQEAYETLIDPHRRGEYDRTGRTAEPRTRPRTNTAGPQKRASGARGRTAASGAARRAPGEDRWEQPDDDADHGRTSRDTATSGRSEQDRTHPGTDPPGEGTSTARRAAGGGRQSQRGESRDRDASTSTHQDQGRESTTSASTDGTSSTAGSTRGKHPPRTGGPAGRGRTRSFADQPRGHDRNREFGADPNFVPGLPRLDPSTMSWWNRVDPTKRVRYEPVHGPARGTMFGAFVALLILLLFAWLAADSALAWLWLALIVLAALAVYRLSARYLEGIRLDRTFVREFGRRAVFGRPGTAEDGDHAEQLTADLLRLYLTRLPGVRIFHGLSLPDSVFADVDHAVLCGRRLVLVESKTWLPGHYTLDDSGGVWRNGHSFRGGVVHLPGALAAYRELLPDVDVRGALLLYPSREGGITTGDVGAHADVGVPPMVPEQFVRRIGEWLAVEETTVDREVFRAVQDQVVSNDGR